MARVPMEIGELGRVRYEPKDGKFIGRAEGRLDEETYKQIQRTAASQAAVDRAMKAGWRKAMADHATALAAAEAAASDAGVAARNGNNPDEWTLETLLSTLVDYWLDRLPPPPKLAATTHRQYGEIGKKLRADIGHISIEDLTIARIETYLAELRDSTERGTWGDQAKTALGTILHAAVKHEIIPVNRGKLADYVPLAAIKKPSLTPEEMARVTEAVRSYDAGTAGKPGPRPTGHLGTAVKLFAATGLRTNELLATRWSDFSFAAGTIEVNATLISPRGPVRRQPHPKSTSGFRVLTLPRYAVEELARHFAKCQREAARMGWKWRDDMPIFPSRTGGWFRDSRLREQFRMATSHLKEDIPSLEFYSYRRTISTRLAETLGDQAAASQLGHSSVSVTARHYIQRSTSVDNAAALED